MNKRLGLLLLKHKQHANLEPLKQENASKEPTLQKNFPQKQTTIDTR